MSKGLRIVLIAALVVALAAIAGYALLGGGSALDGTSWRLEAWSVSATDPTAFTITAEFADGQISGTSAVNSYSGPYTASRSGSFSSGPINSTAMAGSEGAMRAEQTYFALLDQVERFSREGDTLTLADGNDNPLLIFGAAK
jgi:heat shock protein HslJ